MNHYSFYRFQYYQECPFFYKCTYKDKTPVEESEFALDGRVQHDIYRAYTLACLKAKKTHLFSKWEEIAEKTIKAHRITTAQEKVILASVKNYIEGHEIDIKDLAGVEDEIALDKNLKPCKWENGYLRCKIDKLYLRKSEAKITDYKTGQSLKANDFQLELYALMVSKVYPQLKLIELEFDFTRFDYTRNWVIDRKWLARVEKQVLSRIEQIEADSLFKPHIGSKCIDCRFWHLCPAMQHNPKLAKLIPRNKEEAQGLLERYLAQAKVTKELKGILDRYVNSKGEVVVNDMRAFILAKKRIVWDVPLLLEWANREGKQIMDAISIDNRKLGKIVKENEWPKGAYKVKLNTEVEVGKIKEIKNDFK